MLLLIDNYDSFTWNLVHRLGEASRAHGRELEIRVARNDALTSQEALALRPEAIVLSPGPCDPDRAGVCLDLIAAAHEEVPLLGVCLGHQAIGQAFGGSVVRADEIVHGKTSPVAHRGAGVFRDLASPTVATRYHSLTVAREDLPDCLEITAETESGVIMGLAHKSAPTHGVQFHPESIATEDGGRLLTNFLRLAELI